MLHCELLFPLSLRPLVLSPSSHVDLPHDSIGDHAASLLLTCAHIMPTAASTKAPTGKHQHSRWARSHRSTQSQSKDIRLATSSVRSYGACCANTVLTSPCGAILPPCGSILNQCFVICCLNLSYVMFGSCPPSITNLLAPLLLNATHCVQA